MRNRIRQKFEQLRKKGRKAFIAFITAGDPDLKTTEKLVLAFEKNGVDIVELGVPFSDPLADGPTIQAAAQRALKKGTTLTRILAMVRRIRTASQIPIIFMTSYNPIFHFGERRFVAAAKASGVDGVIIPDLPPEEAKTLTASAHAAGLAVIFLITPTTGPDRLKKIIRASRGFVYYVSLAGVTGARKSLPSTIAADVRRAKALTRTPVCVGFGISTPEQVRSVGKVADGVIIGSAIVAAIARHSGRKDLLSSVTRFVRSLTRAIPGTDKHS